MCGQLYELPALVLCRLLVGAAAEPDRGLHFPPAPSRGRLTASSTLENWTTEFHMPVNLVPDSRSRNCWMVTLQGIGATCSGVI